MRDPVLFRSVCATSTPDYKKKLCLRFEKEMLKNFTKRNTDGSLMLSLSVSVSLGASNPGSASMVGVVLPFMNASSSLW